MEEMEMMMEPRFTALRIISVALKVVAVIVAIVGVISAFGALFTTLTVLAKFGAFIGLLVTAAVQVFLLWAGAELITLLIQLERNTYETKEALTRSTMRAA